MKAYVFVTLNLCAMNGADMYVYNKTRYLRERGYKTFVYSAEQGDIMIHGLREYRKYQLPALRLYPGCFSRKTVDGVIRSIRQELQREGCDEVIVESTNLISALWGELLAQDLGCRHLAYILTERFGRSVRSDRMQAYLRFKLSRHELAGIAQSSVSNMLQDDSLPFDESMRIHAFCNNTIDVCEDIVTPQLDPSADMTIGSIGRLDKPYVEFLVEQLRRYFLAHSDRTYNLVMIGGSRSNRSYRQIKKLMAPLENVNLVLTGFMFPIPKSFVDKCDLFISAAGSANATYHQDRPTIKLNPSTGDIIGIPGLTFAFGQYDINTSNAPCTELNTYIDLAMEKRGEIQYLHQMADGAYAERMRAEFDRQLGLLDLCDTFAYHEVLNIKFDRMAYRPFNVLGKVLPPNVLYASMELARKVLK